MTLARLVESSRMVKIESYAMREDKGNGENWVINGRTLLKTPAGTCQRLHVRDKCWDTRQIIWRSHRGLEGLKAILRMRLRTGR